jgi:predicted anti-sigma-YlaC factor YlaD
MNCTEFRELLGSYLEESLTEERRRMFRRHLRECASCRERAVSEDPTLLFAAVPETPVSEADIEACAAAVTAQIKQQRLARNLSSRRRPWLAMAAAAIIMIAGGLSWKVLRGSVETPIPTAAEIHLHDDARSVPPTVEVEMAGEDVRVYQFAVDEDDDTAVYFVVNPAMEL